ncbi:PD-(D/E)XK nuclease family protein [Corynebacterium felinum]|uniref:PD-(D/E)XK endonuclease-like domain-containing protein n=1 Tax=Corynebacterium felinum TaxID=131318 RepID=A0ABU2B4K3_9CORY|nr:PD-(D/E)XK nuclease family protein [Corynebacterium felinum]MDF5820630.1 PD-(D/E)XK nuclease family protein [Corynebacterium felinum]MDR7353547.1 hypothetical protein [Corynebacterium felinum]WJY95728.1 ATP-dependent helicase/deoxyribonuclease subunit B [Corynebacterium felinum]
MQAPREFPDAQQPVARYRRVCEALAQARADNPDPFAHVTIICAPKARESLVCALAAFGPLAGVTILPLAGFVAQSATQLAPRRMLEPADITAEVIQFLHSENSAFREAGIDHQPATRKGLIGAVTRLLALPKAWRTPAHTALRLPQEVARIAAAIAARPDRVTEGEAWEYAGSTALKNPVIIVDFLPRTAREKMLLEQLKKRGAQEVFTSIEDPVFLSVRYADEQAEATGTIRRVREALDRGVPLHRIGVAYCASSSIPDLVAAADQLPLAWLSHTTLIDDPALATLYALLHTPADKPTTHMLAKALSYGCVRWRSTEGKTPRLANFDLLSRKLGVSSVEQFHLEAARSTEAAWVVQLLDDRHRLSQSRSWASWAQAVRELMRTHLQCELSPSAAVAVFDHHLESLSHYDKLTVDFDPDLAEELVSEFLHSSSLANEQGGLYVGAVEDFIGLDLEQLFILGATADNLPRAVPADPAMTWEQRRSSPSEEIDMQRRIFDHVCRTASNTTMSAPVGLSLGPLAQAPSTWLPVELASDATSWHDIPSASHLHGGVLESLAHPEHNPARWRADIFNRRERGVLDEPYNGFFPGGAQWLDLGCELSPTAMDLFLKSPLLFFQRSVLGLSILNDSEGEEIKPTRSGTLFHAIFQQWTTTTWKLDSTRICSAADIDWVKARQDLFAIAEAEFAAFPFGEALLADKLLWWRHAQPVLCAWFDEEQANASQGWVPLAVEQRFATSQREGALRVGPIHSDSDTAWRFTGVMDRIDFHPETGRIRVVDYKTGKPFKTSGSFDTSFPTKTDGLSTLQLHIYGAVIRHALPAGSVDALLAPFGVTGSHCNEDIAVDFWFVQAAENRHVGGCVDQAAEQFLCAQLDRIAAAIRAGQFAPRVVEPRRFGPPADILRLGAKNYERAANAVQEAYAAVEQSAPDFPQGEKR